MRNILLISVFFAVFVSCNSDKTYEKYFIKVVSDFPNKANKYEAYIILPPTSCIPCDNYSVEKSQELLKKKYPVKVIFECFPENYKLFFSKLEEVELVNEDIVIDTLLKYRLPNNIKESNLPLVIYLNKDEIKDIEIQSSSNSEVFENLANYLKSK